MVTRKGEAPATASTVSEGRRAYALGTRSPSMPTQETTQRPWVSVYDGRRCIGHIIGRGKLGHEAFDAENRSLGLHATQKAAADALSKRGAAAYD